MLIVGSATAATRYQIGISGTVVDEHGNPSSFGAGNNTLSDFGTFSRSATDWLDTAIGVPDHGGTVGSEIQMGPQPLVFGVGYATLLTSSSLETYTITLSGTGADPFVPVLFTAKGSATWNQDGDAEATLDFFGTGITSIHDLVQESDVAANRVAGTESFSEHTVVDLIPGQTYQIVISTFAQSDIRSFHANPDGSIDFGFDIATVDPTFTVDPAFASRWSVEGVPVGANLPPSVPEPAIWALLISGFGLAGARLRRRVARLA
ncbi:MAG TPA: PEPxxWA-CTERM sorting domain-containing protein [Polyangia bacterium]